MLTAPPAISTLPLGSNVPVAQVRPVFITGVDAAGANVLVTGSYNSVLLRKLPPAISTLPFGSSVAVASERALFIVGAVAAKPVAGAYNSTLGGAPDLPWPPAINTLPLCSSVAVGPEPCAV